MEPVPAGPAWGLAPRACSIPGVQRGRDGAADGKSTDGGDGPLIRDLSDLVGRPA